MTTCKKVQPLKYFNDKKYNYFLNVDLILNEN